MLQSAELGELSLVRYEGKWSGKGHFFDEVAALHVVIGAVDRVFVHFLYFTAWDSSSN
jgi:hypothetical protein